MSHTSPQSYLVWSMLSCLLGVFLVFHLWRFDRFKCMKLTGKGSQSGAFKRLMTYSYLLSVPLIITYSVGFTIIKYEEGFVELAGFGIIPSPHELWTSAHQAAILPLYLCIAIAWALEMVTHLEELCFWLFVVNAGAIQRDWFRSRYFKTWAMGSIMAIIYMPLVVIFTRADPLKSESCIFLAGSLGSLTLTVWFLPVLWRFPGFLKNLEEEGVDMGTIVRLTKFHELNAIRVLFRFLFAGPLFILAIDGIRPHQHVNESLIATDLLAMASGFGVVVSSGLTLVIFFPRSIEAEIIARRKSKALKSVTPFTQTAPTTPNATHRTTNLSPYAFGNTFSRNRSSHDVSHGDHRSTSPALDKDAMKFDLEDEDFDQPLTPATGTQLLHYNDGTSVARHRDVHTVVQTPEVEAQPPAFSDLSHHNNGRGGREVEAGVLPPLKTDFDRGTAASRRQGQSPSTGSRPKGFGRRATDKEEGESVRSWGESPGGHRDENNATGQADLVTDARSVRTSEDPFGSPTLTLPSYTFTAPQHHSYATAHLTHPLPSTIQGDHSEMSRSEPPPPNPFKSPVSSSFGGGGGSPVVPSPSGIPSPQATIASAVNWNASSLSSHAQTGRIAPVKLEPNRRPTEPEGKSMKKKSSVDRLLMRKTSTKTDKDMIEMKESPSTPSRAQTFGIAMNRTASPMSMSNSIPESGSISAPGSMLLTEGNLERHNTDGTASFTGSGVGSGSGGTVMPSSPLVPNRLTADRVSPKGSRMKVKAKEVKERRERVRERDVERDARSLGARLGEPRESVHFVSGFRSPIDMRRGDGSSSDD